MSVRSKFLAFGWILFIALLVAALLQHKPNSNGNESAANGKASASTGGVGTQITSFEACVGKGTDYFKNIGSFPKLSNGRMASDVAYERCGRTVGAFDL
jgi:hypothetical protein